MKRRDEASTPAVNKAEDDDEGEVEGEEGAEEERTRQRNMNNENQTRKISNNVIFLPILMLSHRWWVRPETRAWSRR